MTNMRRVMFGGVLLAVLAGGVVVWRAVAEPPHPDPATTALDQAVAFVGTDDFNRLSAARRTDYCLAVAERLRERSFPQLLSMVAARNTDYKRVADNVHLSGGREDIEAAVIRVMMDKFYEEPPERRKLYLWGLVRLQQSGAAGREGVGLPSPKQLHRDMTRVVTRQPPQTVAKMGQFVQDLQTQRRSMGVADPY